MKINFKYLVSFVVIFFIEVLIALYINDDFIRPYVGDTLVIVLMYTFVRAIIKKKIKYLPIYLFGFATLVEVLQYLNIVEVLGLQNNRILAVAIGSTFDLKDVFCYLIGAIILMFWEKYERERS
ncbi:MAG: DUF2809 domain-containing protein [Clostridium sp.]